MKILVIDDHRMFADGLRFLLESRNETVEMREAGDAGGGLEILAGGFAPDIVLLDLNLPGMSGLTLLQQLRSRGHTFPVLIVSASQSVSDAGDALAHGASGFVSKASNGQQLLEAIDRVLAGGSYLPAGWDELVGGEGAAANLQDRLGITNRQLEVLSMVAQGHSNKVIADRLKLSENTVKVHLREVFRALGVSNRTACVQAAKQHGLVSD